MEDKECHGQWLPQYDLTDDLTLMSGGEVRNNDGGELLLLGAEYKTSLLVFGTIPIKATKNLSVASQVFKPVRGTKQHKAFTYQQPTTTQTLTVTMATKRSPLTSMLAFGTNTETAHLRLLSTAALA